MLGHYIKLARPIQWAKGVFVLIGPLYGLADMNLTEHPVSSVLVTALFAVVAFSLASSGCYVINDILDAPRDRKHPRKKNRPIASGKISPKAGITFALLLYLSAAAAVFLLPASVRLWFGIILAAYVVNVIIYSFTFKHIVITDVMGLSMGFVLRVIGGCIAVGIAPTVWLLNVTFFLAMFLAFSKRLGERRTDGFDAAAARGVQAAYTDELLRMAVVVTAVAALLTYASYLQAQTEQYGNGWSVLWITLLPATYGLLRCIVLVEGGKFDDPTELAARDRPFQAAGLAFALITLFTVWQFRFAAGPI